MEMMFVGCTLAIVSAVLGLTLVLLGWLGVRDVLGVGGKYRIPDDSSHCTVAGIGFLLTALALIVVTVLASNGICGFGWLLPAGLPAYLGFVWFSRIALRPWPAPARQETEAAHE